MGDDDDRQVAIFACELCDGSVDPLFGAVVERRGRLVEEENVGLFVECAGDPDPLPLPAGKTVTGLSDRRIHPLRERCDELVEFGGPDGFTGTFAVDLLRLFAEGNVFEQRSVGQKDVLRDVSDRILPHPAILFGERVSVDGDFSGRRAVKSQQQVEKGRLAGTRCPLYADVFPLADRQREVVQNLHTLRVILESE